MNVLLSLTMQHQLESEWCWAAVAASVDAFLSTGGASPPRSQCEVANLVLSTTRCCGDPASCNVDALLEDALQAVGHLNGEPFAGTASFDSIRTVTSPPYSVPVGVRVSDGSDGHFLLIVGFLDDDGRQWIHTADSLYGPGTYDMDAFASSYQGAVWTNTYSIA